MAIWGGTLASGTYLSTGATYDPSTDIWTLFNPNDVPQARSDHSTVWTGSDFIVWGGYGANGILDSGGRYRVSAQAWLPLESSGAPTARYANVAVWTGSRMLIWGGRNNNGILNDGALYDPAANSWAALGLANAPAARYNTASVLAGDTILLWGGQGATGALGDGVVIPLSGGLPLPNFLRGGYIPIATTGSPAPRSRHTAIWTGDRMIIWGGISSQSQFYSDGFMYDPVGKSWTPISSVNAPTARERHSAVWTGTEMVIIAGRGGAGALSDAHAYDPASDRWRQLSGNVGARYGSTAVLTGSQVIVFGGESDSRKIAQPMEIDPTPPVHLYSKQ